MAARAIGSGTVSFGLVSIPVKFYSATSDHQVSFHMLHAKCGTRVRTQFHCPLDKEVVPRQDLVRGFEHAKDQFVRFTDEELAQLEGERSDRVDIVEFVPDSSIDPVYIIDTRYLGPGKGGERAYKLLSDSMARTKRVAVGRYGARGREQLVLLRPYKGGIVMHQVHYADEVHPMDEVEIPRAVSFQEAEIDLADRLVKQLSADAFDPSRHPDQYQARVLAAVEEKIAGKEVSTTPEAPKAEIVDLFEALKRSLAERAPAPAEPTRRAPEAAGTRLPPGPSVRKVQPMEDLEGPKPLKKAGGGRRTRDGEDTGTG